MAYTIWREMSGNGRIVGMMPTPEAPTVVPNSGKNFESYAEVRGIIIIVSGQSALVAHRAIGEHPNTYPMLQDFVAL